MMRFRAPFRPPFPSDPWHEIEGLRRAFGRLGDRSVRRAFAPAVGSGFIPQADLYDTGMAFVMYVDLPGVSERDLDIAVEGSMLTIRGQRDAQGSGGMRSMYSERPAGRFARTIELPDSVDVDRVRATLKQGVLEITLPKSRTVTTKRVVVVLAETGWAP